jgi:hypothetical protein
VLVAKTANLPLKCKIIFFGNCAIKKTLFLPPIISLKIYCLQSLLDAESEWDELNGGRVFGTAPNQILLPAAGYRYCLDGGMWNTGTYGLYWSSSVDGLYARKLCFLDGSVLVDLSNRANGFGVRCVAEL